MSKRRIFYIKYCNYLGMVVVSSLTVYAIAKLVGGVNLWGFVGAAILSVILVPVLYEWDNKVKEWLAHVTNEAFVSLLNKEGVK